MSHYTKPLEERERALEAAFFNKENERLLDAIRKEKEHEESLRALAEICGFRDEQIQDALIDMGISRETLAAFSLAPLVATAWANGFVTDDERATLLECAHEEGIEEGSEAHALLDAWLKEKPPENLLEAWLAFAHAMDEHTAGSQRGLLVQESARRAEAIARASGGVAGIGAVSAAEQAVIDAILGAG